MSPSRLSPHPCPLPAGRERESGPLTAPSHTAPAPPRWADRYLEQDAFALLGFDGDELISSVAFRTHAASVAHVGLVFVRPSHWRRGIARRMLGLAEAEMCSRGFARERLWTPLGAPAEQFYRAQGWKLDGRREWHPWVGLEMVGYTKELA